MICGIYMKVVKGMLPIVSQEGPDERVAFSLWRCISAHMALSVRQSTLHHLPRSLLTYLAPSGFLMP